MGGELAYTSGLLLGMGGKGCTGSGSTGTIAAVGLDWLGSLVSIALRAGSILAKASKAKAQPSMGLRSGSLALTAATAALRCTGQRLPIGKAATRRSLPFTKYCVTGLAIFIFISPISPIVTDAESPTTSFNFH